VKRVLWGVVFLMAAAVVGLMWLAHGEHKGFAQPVLVSIPRGSSTARMGELLAAQGVVRSPLHFQAARLMRRGALLQAGDYRFVEPASASAVLDRLVKGDIYRLSVTIPEGSSRFDIARILERAGFGTAQEFLAASAAPDLIRDLAPRAPSLEGYLFPATYLFSPGTNATQICKEMTRRFRQVWRGVGASTPPDQANRLVTLASLVEKETGVPAEREVVASVYWNRLQDNMRLECDPTVIYAAQLLDKWRGKIHRSDLDRDHPYNTYRHAGLPPGPIANPGQKSLEAALRPAQTDYLFFVARADGSGGHNFSRDLKSHQKAVVNYRNAVKKSTSE